MGHSTESSIMALQHRPSHPPIFSSLPPCRPTRKPYRLMVHKCTHYGNISDSTKWYYEVIGYLDWWDFTKKPQKNLDKVVGATTEEENLPSAFC